MQASGIDADVRIDPERVAVAYTSDRWLRVSGGPPPGFAPLSGFFRAADGWVRTHANYPHHRAALLRGLALPATSDPADVRAALATRSVQSTVAAVSTAGGLCVPVRAGDPVIDAAWREGPLVGYRRMGDAARLPRRMISPEAPLRGIRVLDLTRVIAGPIATRTLGFLGADVLRIDPPHLPELPAQHLDTGHGKRSALLDATTARGAGTIADLVRGADVVALGYRPAALARLGLSPSALARLRPGVVVLQLSAWGEPGRRGFDSLVQAESGIALAEGAHGEPGALPAQALDHSAGYLLAAAAMDLLARRDREGGSWLAETSLRRIAAELAGLPRRIEPLADIRRADPEPHLQDFDVAGVPVRTAGPAVLYPGGPIAFAPPRPWGGDDPQW